MNLDELKPLLKTYQDQVGRHDRWSKSQLTELLQEQSVVIPWYARSSRLVLNVCVSIFLIGMNGC